jgi:UV DNA damage endonuclease
VGSGAPDRATALERFVGAAERLPEPARRRLVVENDDRAFGLADVLEVSRRTGAPVVWDVHHHRCLDREGIPEREALDLALATWPAGVRPKVHYRRRAGAARRRGGSRCPRRAPTRIWWTRSTSAGSPSRSWPAARST